MTFGYIGMETARLDIRRRMLINLRLLSGNAMLRGYYEGRYVRDREDLAANRIVRENLIGVRNPGVELIVGADQFPGDLLHWVRQAQNELGVEPAVSNFDPASFHVTIFMLNPFYNTDMAGSQGDKRPYNGPAMYRGSRALRYSFAIRQALGGLGPFDIDLIGLGASSAAVFLQGYDRGILNDLRADLLLRLEEHGLEFTDKQPEVVHCVIARFVSNLRDPAGFIARVDSLRGREFGSLRVQKISLVGAGGLGRPFDLLDEFKLPV